MRQRSRSPEFIFELLVINLTSMLPPDALLVNRIETLAQFVAKNGSNFERMLLAKQQNNPEFHFLFGGPYHHYYKERREIYSRTVSGPPPPAFNPDPRGQVYSTPESVKYHISYLKLTQK